MGFIKTHQTPAYSSLLLPTSLYFYTQAIMRNMAVIYSRAGDLPKCLKCMLAASEFNPEAWLLQEKVAMLALQCENLQLAQNTLAAIKEKWGDQEEVMNAVCVN